MKSVGHDRPWHELGALAVEDWSDLPNETVPELLLVPQKEFVSITRTWLATFTAPGYSIKLERSKILSTCQRKNACIFTKLCLLMSTDVASNTNKSDVYQFGSHQDVFA